MKEIIKYGLHKIVGTMETFYKDGVTIIRCRKTKKIIKIVK